MANRTQVTLAALATVAAATLLAGCGGNSTTGSSSTASSGSSQSGTPTGSASGNPVDNATCTLASISKALPADARILKFQCSSIEGTSWAVVTLRPGTTTGPAVYFLENRTGNWTAHAADEICGGASADIPAELLNYCPA